MHYNPANDPEVINGIQSAYGFNRGEQVFYTNSYGRTFGPYAVVGFVQNPDPDHLPENTVYINSESYWYPVKPDTLTKAFELTEEDRAKVIIGFAEKHAENPVEMPSSARSCLHDAIACLQAKKYGYACTRALASLAYSIGVFHPDFRTVETLINATRETGI